MSLLLSDRIQELGHPRILVVGDAILDRYVFGNAERVSQEAPVILLRADREEARLGGAANVAHMVRGLEADVSLAGIVGDDFAGAQLRHDVDRAGIDASFLLTDIARPTTVKDRYIGRAQNRHPHQMLRVDREVREPLSREITDRLLGLLLPQLASYQAILIADYGKGVCTPALLSQLLAVARQHQIPVIVDPRPGADFSHYRGATAITPNRLETQLATGRDIHSIDDAFVAGRRLCNQLELQFSFITLDSDGIALVWPDGTATHLPTRKRLVYDITGAGDMVLAMIGVGLSANLPPADIARLANVAGGLEVERVGVVPVTREEILADILAGSRTTSQKISDLEHLKRQIQLKKQAGQRIVFTNGCFDLLHAGHVRYLEEAAQEGDCLIVALNSDASVRQLDKGPDRPLFAEADRAGLIAALEAVDHVVVFDELTPHRLLTELRPDVLVKGGTYARHEIVGHEIVEAYGGIVKPLGVTPGVSTTSIVARLRAATGSATQPPSLVPHSPAASRPDRTTSVDGQLTLVSATPTTPHLERPAA